MSVKVDFALVGAAKSATTTLFRHLGKHDEISFIPAAQELGYFSGPQGAGVDERLEGSYGAPKPGQVVGISDVNMLMFGHAAARIHDHNPDTRIIAILRNPIERAHSAYWFARNHGWDEAPSLEDALQRELQGNLASRFERVNFTHLERGHYAEQLDVYIGVFGAGQVKVLLTEELAAEPESTMADLFEWLGVSSEAGGISSRERHNVATRARFPRATPIIVWASAPARAVLRRIVPKSGRHWTNQRLLPPLQRFSRVPFVRPAMKPETRAWLRSYYEPHNEKLGRLMNRDFSHWR